MVERDFGLLEDAVVDVLAGEPEKVTLTPGMVTDDNYENWITLLEHAPFITTDTESTGLQVFDGTDYLVGIACAWDWDGYPTSCYFPFRHEGGDNLSPEKVLPLKIILESKPLVFHNCRHDFSALKTIGIDEPQEFYDTMIMAHMVNEEFPSKELDWLAKFIIKEGKKDDALKVWTKNYGWKSVPARLMAPYACQDTLITHKLFKILWKEMEA